MRIIDWSSDVCSSDLRASGDKKYPYQIREQRAWLGGQLESLQQVRAMIPAEAKPRGESVAKFTLHPTFRSEEHTSELQSLMRISYAVFCLTKKNKRQYYTPQTL